MAWSYNATNLVILKASFRNDHDCLHLSECASLCLSEVSMLPRRVNFARQALSGIFRTKDHSVTIRVEQGPILSSQLKSDQKCRQLLRHFVHLVVLVYLACKLS